MKTEIPELPRKDRSRRAFSLIEVVLALGIVSFALLTVVGMLPVGLTSVHNGQVLQATSNIADQIRGQVQLLSFVSGSANATPIQSLNGTNFYYTVDGFPLTSSTGAYYDATLAVYAITNSTSSTTVPVVDTSFNTNNAQSVVVTVTYPPGAWNQTNTFSFLVARQTDN